MLERGSIFRATTLLAALALALHAAPASAAEACIPPKVIAAVADCAGVASLPAMSGAELLAAYAARGRPVAPLGLLPGAKKRERAAKKRSDTFLSVPFSAAEARLDDALRRFLCEDKPAAGDTKAQALHGEVAYVRARIHFEAQHWEEAAVLFREVAMRGPADPAGIFAQQLYLESLNVLGGSIETPRPACFDDDMPRDIPTFRGLYCKDGKDKANEEACGVLLGIERDILRLEAERWVKKGDAEQSDSAYEAGAKGYLRVWTEYYQKPCEAREPGCSRAEEVLYNAARAYQAAHLIDKTIALRKLLLDPRYNLDNTSLARKARYELGAIYGSLAVHDEAASWYESYAAQSPGEDKAPEALSDAIVLRLALGQRDRAEKDADLFNKNYGSKKPAQTAQVAYAIAADALERGDREGAKKRFSAAMGQIDKNGALSVQVRAHAGLGRALVLLGKRPEAAVEYGKAKALVEGLYQRLGARSLKQDEVDEVMEVRSLVGMLTAAGEALFFFGEEKRLAAEALARPAFSGAGSPDETRDYLGTKLGAWVAQRRAAIDEAEKAYRAIAALEPQAPPKWEVAAAERVAWMRGKLAAEIRATPAPKGWKAQGPSPWGKDFTELRAAWVDALEQLSAPEEARAKLAYRGCVSLTAKLWAGAPEAQRCSAWLARHEPAAYPRLDELMDRPTHRADGLLPSPPLPAP
jgi:hypothetical protein